MTNISLDAFVQPDRPSEHGPFELQDADRSPAYRLSCGCVAIPLYSKGQHVEGTTRVLLLQACDRDPTDDDECNFNVRDVDIEKVVRAERLSTEEWHGLLAVLQAYFHMGRAEFNLHRALTFQHRCREQLQQRRQQPKET